MIHGLTRVARIHPGRRAHLLHPRADARRARAPARPSSSTCCATTGSTTSTSSCPPRDPRTSTSAPTRRGRRRPGRSRRSPPSRVSSWCPTRAGPRSTAPRSRCRPATPSAAPGRCRRSSSTSTCPSGSSSSTPRADGSRQQPVMIHRALFGSIERFIGGADRALRRRVPALAGAGAGRRASRSPTRHNDYLARRRRADAGAGHAGRGRRLRRPDAEEDPQRPAPEGAVHGDRR